MQVIGMSQSYLSMSRTVLLFVTLAVCSPVKRNKCIPTKKGSNILHIYSWTSALLSFFFPDSRWQGDTVMTCSKMPTNPFHYFPNDVDSPASTGVAIIYLLKSSTRHKHSVEDSCHIFSCTWKTTEKLRHESQRKKIPIL